MLVKPLLAVLLVLGLTGPTLSAELDEGSSLAIRTVIERQLAAFQRDDGVEAFSYASPTIQRKFQSSELFMAMVRGGYRAVYRPRQVEFGELRVVDGVPTQEVHFIGPDGRAVTAIYQMQQQSDGSWKINGVYMVETPEAAA